MRLHIANDHVEITFDNGSTIKFEGKDDATALQLGDGSAHAAVVEKLEDLYGALLDWLDAHTHSTGVGPSGTPIPRLASAPLETGGAPWDPLINSTKLSFPAEPEP